MINILRGIAIASVVASGLFGSASVANAETETDPVVARAMVKVAKAVFKFMDEENRSLEIVVGDISGLPNMKASGGVELSRTLEDALENAGFKIDDDASTQLMGSFRMVEQKAHIDDDYMTLALKVDLTVLDEFGKELGETEVTVFGNQILQIAGLNTNLPAKGSNRVKQREIIRQYKDPDTELKGNEICNGGPFGIEVLVNNSGTHGSKVPTLDSKGRPFVGLHLGEEYLVRIHNHADFECSVSLLIDGVNAFVNTEDEDVPVESQYVVPAGKHITVPGWFITKHNSKAFEIGGFEESVAGQQGESRTSNKIGTITATFQACWEVGGTRPADEPGGNAKGGKATKQGRDISKEYKAVKREFGALRGTISVRYDR